MNAKLSVALALAGLLAGGSLRADDEPPRDLAKVIEKHQVGSGKLANDQDELSADVQELIEEQTSDQVIDLLDEVELIMGEVIDNLDARDTGGGTIAAETEVIEKIFEAAKKRAEQQQQQEQEGEEPQEGEEGEEGEEGQPQPGQGQGQAGGIGAMLDMMQRMMGQEPGEEPGEGEGEGPGGEKGGEGQTGDSDKPNRKIDGSATGDSGTRTVPKKAGTAGTGLPPEFNKALDAYNRIRPEGEQP